MPTAHILMTSSIFFEKVLLHVSLIMLSTTYPTILNCHLSLLSKHSLISYVTLPRMVFSPMKLAILFKLSAATERRSVFAWISSSSYLAYQASKSSSNSIPYVIIKTIAGKNWVFSSFAYFLTNEGSSSDKVVMISKADYLVEFSKLAFFIISLTTKINLGNTKLHISPLH